MPEEEMGFIGKLKIGIFPDTTGFGALLRSQISALTSGIRATVQVDADGDHLQQEVRAAAQKAATSTTVEIDVDDEKFKQAIQRAADAARDENIQLELDFDGSGLAMDVAAAADAAGQNIQLQLDLDEAGLQSKVEVAAARASGETVDIDVDLDDDGFVAKVKMLAARARGEEVNIRVDDRGSIRNVDNSFKKLMATIGQTNRSFTFLRNIGTLLKFPAIIAGAQLLAQALGALGAAAVGLASSLGTAAGALAALPGLLAAAAQGAIAAAFAFSGIGKALKAMNTAGIKSATGGGGGGGGGESAEDRARRIEDANERVEDAERSLARAQRDAARSMEEAHERVADAAEDLARTEERVAKDIIDAHEDVQDAIEDLADARDDAARRDVQAARRFEEAQRSLTRAHVDAREAQEDLNEARDDAIDRLEALKVAASGLVVDEQKALNAIKLAQREYEATVNNPRQHEAARIRLLEAQHDLERIRHQRQENAEDQAEYDAQGAEGTDMVQDALERYSRALERIEDAEYNLAQARQDQVDAGVEGQRRIADAIEALADAQQNVQDTTIDGARAIRDAQRAMADAQENVALTFEDTTERVADAQRDLERAVRDASRALEDMGSAGGGAVDKVAEAMANLPQSARDFVKFLFSLKPYLDELRKTASDNLFPGLTTAIKTLIPLFPVFNKMVGETAKALADLAIDAANMIAGWGPDLDQIFAQNTLSLRQFGEAFLNLFSALKDIMVVAGPLQAWLGELAIRLSENVRGAVEAGRASGGLAEFFEQVRSVIEKILTIGGNLIGTLFNIGKAGQDMGHWILDSLVKVTESWERWTGSVKGQNVMKQWMEDSKPALEAMAGLVGDVAKAFAEISKGDEIVAIIDKVRNELLPTLVDLADSVKSGFGPALIDALTSFSKLLEQIMSHSGGLTAFVKIFGMIAEAAAWILENVPGLASLLSILAALRGGMIAVSIAGGLLHSLFSTLPAIVNGLADAFDFLRFAFSKIPMLISGIVKAFNVLKLAFLANPWLLLGAAIIALVALVIMNWDKIKEVFSSAMDFIKEHSEVFIRVILGVLTGGLSELVIQFAGGFDKFKEIIGNAWDWIVEKTKAIWNAIWDFLFGGSIIPDIWNAFTDYFSRIKEFIASIWENIKETTSNVWNAIKSFLSGLWDGIKNVASTVWNALVSFFSDRWNNIRNNTQAVWDGIRNLLSGIWNGIRDTASNVWNAVTGAIGSAVDRASGTIRSVWDGIRGFIGGVMGWIRDTISGAWNYVRDVISNTIATARNNVQSAIEAIKGFFQGLLDKVRTVVDYINKNAEKLMFWKKSPSKMEVMARESVKGVNASWDKLKPPKLDAASEAVRRMESALGGIRVPAFVMPQLSVGVGESAAPQESGLREDLKALISKIEQASLGLQLNFNEGSIVSQHPDDIAGPVFREAGWQRDRLSSGRI